MVVGGELIASHAFYGAGRTLITAGSGEVHYMHPKFVRFYQVACIHTGVTFRLPDPALWPGQAVGTSFRILNSIASTNSFTVVDHLSGTSFAQVVNAGDIYEFILNTKTEAGATTSAHDIWSVFQVGSGGSGESVVVGGP